ncbi:TPA: hypothetical protein ACH3X1_010678 [Trebouxia sp. C0004]
MLPSRLGAACCYLLVFTLCIALFASGSWIPNDSPAAAAEYQNRGPSATAYELTLGDLLPENLLAQNQSLNFVNKYFRLVGPALWPVTPKLVQSLHQVAKKVCGTTRYVCQVELGVHQWHPGPCQKECLLQVFPLIDDGDVCQACGRASSHIWQDQNLAGLNLNVTVNYTRESMLLGTTMTSFARDITTMLQSQHVQAHAYALLYEPQPTAAVIVPFYPLAPLASKAEGWEIAFMASGNSVLPFGLENENKMLAGLNALELTSQYTSYWRAKSITEDVKKGSVTVVLICIRQPDRHGKMGAAAAEVAIQQLEQELINDGSNWRLQFLRAKRAPQESFAEKFKQLARCGCNVASQAQLSWRSRACSG